MLRTVHLIARTRRQFCHVVIVTSPVLSRNVCDYLKTCGISSHLGSEQLRADERQISRGQQSPASTCSTSANAGSAQTHASTVEAVCKEWTNILESNGIPEAEVSTKYFVAHVLGKKTLHEINGKRVLNNEQVKTVVEFCQRRLKHEPVQYILEEWDFDDVVLKMRAPVFIPRPETEELVGIAAELIEKNCKQSSRLLELCCGSGAITLALLHRFTKLQAVAVDISEDACRLTQDNAGRLRLDDRITVLQGDLSDPSFQMKLKMMKQFSMLISNPPYVPAEEIKSLELQITRFEDLRALDGGEDGLDITRQILPLAPQLLEPGSDILLEMHPGQPRIIQEMCARDTRNQPLLFIASVDDYLGRERFCHLRTNNIKTAWT